jgi:hypothetical protein
VWQGRPHRGQGEEEAAVCVGGPGGVGHLPAAWAVGTLRRCTAAQARVASGQGGEEAVRRGRSLGD